MNIPIQSIKKKKSFKMPHSYVIIFMILILASLMTYFIPAGEYGRYKNELGKMVVDGSVFNWIKQSPVPIWDIPLYIIKSLNKQSEIIFALIVIGGSLEVIISTEMFYAFCNKLSKASAGKEKLFIPAFVLLFAIIGITQSTNKFIGFAPLGVMLAITLGYDAIVGVAIVLLGIGVGFSTGILAPTTAVAQEIAGLPAYSGMGLRIVSFIVFYLITTAYILRYGEKIRKDPTKSVVYGCEGLKEFNVKDVDIEIQKKHYAVLIVVLGAFSVLMYGCIKFGWGLSENAVLFIWMAILGGFAYGYSPSEIAKNFVKGSKAMVSAALVVGLGATVAAILNEGKVLDTVGHACGHHMQGPSIVGAALALKEVLKDHPFKVVVYGTPAEETIGGKLKMVKEGCFKDIDVAMMMHGGPETTTDVKSLALSKFKVIFNGKSALDALILSFQGIEFMREHVIDDVRMHYTILSAGGTAANVVPAQAIGSFYVRSYNRDYLNDVVRRFKNVMNGAALTTDTSCEIITEKEIDNKIPVLSLNDIVMENAKLVNAPTIRPPRQKTGSTDFGSVMYKVPGTCIRVAFVEEGTSSHSEEYLKAGKSDKAHNAILLAAKILADSSYDLISNKELFNEVKEEFIKAKEAAKR